MQISIIYTILKHVEKKLQCLNLSHWRYPDNSKAWPVGQNKKIKMSFGKQYKIKATAASHILPAAMTPHVHAHWCVFPKMLSIPEDCNVGKCVEECTVMTLRLAWFWYTAWILQPYCKCIDFILSIHLFSYGFTLWSFSVFAFYMSTWCERLSFREWLRSL